MFDNICNPLEISSTTALKVKKAIANVVVRLRTAWGFFLGNFIVLM